MIKTTPIVIAGVDSGTGSLNDGSTVRVISFGPSSQQDKDFATAALVAGLSSGTNPVLVQRSTYYGDAPLTVGQTLQRPTDVWSA